MSASCHVAFAYPADWEVVPDTATDPGTPCMFAVRPRDWQQRAIANDSSDVYTISLQVVARGVKAQLDESAFRKRGAKWVVLGRQDMVSPADSIAGSGWTGLKGTATQGCYRMSGDYAGLCDQPTALVGTATRSVMAYAGPQAEAEFLRILATLRIEK